MSSEPSFIQAYQSAVETTLNTWLPSNQTPPKNLHEAMRYSIFNGGKRIRPALVYATGLALGIEDSILDVPAAAIEMVHTYSLIHDDLPAMDDDDLRRGQLSCHKKYGEPIAILAGNALQTLAFRVLAEQDNKQLSKQQYLQMISILAIASGSQGMVAGQAIDINSTGKQLSQQKLQEMHTYKTGMLIEASVKLGALSQPEIDTEIFERLINYARCIGLAFQIRDDILDIQSSTEFLGKHRGSDVAKNKVTYPQMLGLDNAKNKAIQYYQEAIENLSIFDHNADTLKQIADYIMSRNH